MTTNAIRNSVDAVFGLPVAIDIPLAPPTLGGELDPEIFSATEAVTRPFSAFHRDDAVAAAKLAGDLGRIAEQSGLERATAAAATVAKRNAGLARHALALFATHHSLGRQVPIPTLLKRTAFVATAATAEAEVALGSASTGPEVALDWFREDPLANEHHEHWHWVYPNQQSPVKQRHGELFYYMHQQMLARYDAERTAVGLPPVQPLETFNGSIGEGYDPGLLVTAEDYERREANEPMVDQPGYSRADLTELSSRLKAAALERRLGSGATGVVLQGHQGSDLLGHEAEPTAAAQFTDHYGWHHGMGHMLIAAASDDLLGVMRDPSTAIRDPAFWRWHRHVDDIHFGYQDALDAHAFTDGPAVAIRDLGFEFENTAANGGAPDQLLTTMRMGVYQLLNGRRYRYGYLTHEPFRVRATLENTGAVSIPVTLRLFLIPHDLFDIDADPTAGSGRQIRRFAIELDKVKIEAAPGMSQHVRAGRDMSVIRRPAVVDPAEVADIAGGDTDIPTQECTCGWPFGLLIPRGTAAGMAFSLFAMVTDNALDRVGSQKACGSMSFCGVGDSYPDARPMGYPFDRPLEQSLRALVAANVNMALRPLTIRWTNPPNSPTS